MSDSAGNISVFVNSLITIHIIMITVRNNYYVQTVEDRNHRIVFRKGQERRANFKGSVVHFLVLRFGE